MTEKPKIRGIDVDKFIRDLEQYKEEKRQEILSQLTTKEHLILMMYSDTISIPFEHPLGSFEVEVRANISDADMRRLIEAVRIIEKGKGDIEKASETINQVLAKITVDPELDEEFWRSGEYYSTGFAMKILEAVLEKQAEEMEEIQSFRRKRRRADSSRSVQDAGESSKRVEWTDTTGLAVSGSGDSGRKEENGEGDGGEVDR